jgi:two-component system OmpR family sensor kinase
LPIRWRLTLFIALVIGVILLLLGITLFFLLREALLLNLEDTTRSRALSAARDIGSGENLDQDDIEQLTIDGVFVVIRDEGGNTLNQTVNLATDKEATDLIWRRAINSGEAASGIAELTRDDSSDYVYAVPVSLPNGPTLIVEAGKSYQSTEESIKTVQTILAAGIGVALLLSVAGAYFLARAALRPVDAVVSSAREMTESDLTKRLPVMTPKDEIGRLTTTINGFLARLEAAFARREDALTRQRRFAADASHELRTPLTSISGHARMLDEWALEEDPKTAKRSVGIIRREARRMRDLVESLLALSRGDEGAPMNVGWHDLAAVAEEAVQAVRTAANGTVFLEYVPPVHAVEATFDSGCIFQVVTILLDNAVQYTQEGGRVVVSVEENEGWLALDVSDTGVGIPEDELPLIFERFYRTDLARTESGVGLGLAIARQIAESHGGRIQAQSTPGEGSTFTLFLPH